MKQYIEERAVEIAYFIITSNATVRETAKKFGISKSTVHTVVPIRVGVDLTLNMASNAANKGFLSPCFFIC